MYFYLNGEILESELAKVSVLDHGFTVGDGVFETLKITEGKCFALERHLVRLQKSASGMGLLCPDVNQIESAVSLTLAANEALTLGRLRITLTSGDGPLGSDRVKGEPTLAITLATQDPWPEFTSAVLVPWVKNERSSLVGLKTTSYGENVVALELAHNLGFSEAIQCDTQGRLSEGTGSNVFLVSDGEIYTPALSAGLLAGITRDLVLDIATDLGIVINEQDIAEDFLFTAQEAFLTSSTRDVHPISRLGKCDARGNISIDSSLHAHDLTNKIADAFRSLNQQGGEV